MTCGSLGCGRQLYGGIGGNGHGLDHFKQSGHPVSVKLGTITPEGEAGTSHGFSTAAFHVVYRPKDIFCYLCDETRQDLELAAHLSTFGINVRSLSKTEKSMTELVCLLVMTICYQLFN
jgi:ubiquitin carboxyl-terminal hydrolase 5/13